MGLLTGITRRIFGAKLLIAGEEVSISNDTYNAIGSVSVPTNGPFVDIPLDKFLGICNKWILLAAETKPKADTEVALLQEKSLNTPEIRRTAQSTENELSRRVSDGENIIQGVESLLFNLDSLERGYADPQEGSAKNVKNAPSIHAELIRLKNSVAALHETMKEQLGELKPKRDLLSNLRAGYMQ
jgi:hypothetical protein